MKKVLIVGGTGFLGFHFAKYCLSQNFEVISVSRKKPKKIRYLKKIKYIYENISNKKKVMIKLKPFSDVNYVVNFGGEVEHKKLKSTFESHYNGAKNICDFYLNKSLKKYLQVGSSLEYGKSKSPHKEHFLLKPNSNYARAKKKATNYLLNFYKKKNFPTVVIRPYQIYGPYQDLNRLIPFVIYNCLKNKKFPCSDGKQHRDFLYVDDFVKIVFKILINKRYNGEVFNIGFGRACSVKKVINLITNITNKGNPDFGKIKLRKEENLISYPSILKVKKLIGWEPKINLIEGLSKTIKFYQKESI